ncbi:MAG: spondin domain-containing protein, partial [Pseudomonadota bacterium]
TGGPGITFDAVNADFTRPGFQVARITIAAAEQPYLVQVQNLAPAGGTFLTPTWVGFHNGEFDLYDRGAPVSPGVESLAEDGALDTLNAEFEAAVIDGVQSAALDPAGFEGAPVIDADGFIGQAVVNLDPGTNRYLSYASMVIPSNDAFIANGSPFAHEVFDENGNFLSPRFIVSNEEVLDAGTEENTETEAAFLNQTGPNTGTDENGVVTLHPGFNGSFSNPGGTPVNILGGTNGAGLSFDANAADFSREGRQIAAISVTPLIDQSYSGSWFSPERSGEGLVLEVVNNDQPEAVISFYTYTADGSGDPIWAIGSGPLVGDTAFAALVVGSGATFGSAFDPATVALDAFGEVAVRFETCTTGTLTVTPVAEGFEEITYPIERLTPLSVGQGNCRAQ